MREFIESALLVVAVIILCSCVLSFFALVIGAIWWTDYVLSHIIFLRIFLSEIIALIVIGLIAKFAND